MSLHSFLHIELILSSSGPGHGPVQLISLVWSGHKDLVVVLAKTK